MSLRERVLRLLGDAPQPCGWPTKDGWVTALPAAIEQRLGMIRWNNTISAVAIAADLEALEYLPREFGGGPVNDTNPETDIPTLPAMPRRVA